METMMGCPTTIRGGEGTDLLGDGRSMVTFGLCDGDERWGCWCAVGWVQQRRMLKVMEGVEVGGGGEEEGVWRWRQRRSRGGGGGWVVGGGGGGSDGVVG